MFLQHAPVYPADLPAPTPGRGRAVPVLAWLTAAATFPLVWMGGLVTSHDAGMSVPDWPNSFGYSMFTLPWDRWLGPYAGGVFYEHSHRLLGTLVGLLAIALTAVAWRTERRAWVRWAASALLAAIVVQGLLGGFRVTQVSQWLAGLHGVFGQIVFSGAAVLVLVTGRWWATVDERGLTPRDRAGPHDPAGLPVAFAWGVTGLIVVQLLLGAAMRHDPQRSATAGSGAGLAIPDVPLSYDRVLPPVSAEGLTRANADRMYRRDLPIVSLGQIWLHFAHRVGATVVATGAIVLATRLLRRAPRRSGLAWPSWTLLALLAVQVTLGVLTVVWRKPADVATAHQATGALLLVTGTVLACRVHRVAWCVGRRRGVSGGAIPASPRQWARSPRLPLSWSTPAA